MTDKLEEDSIKECVQASLEMARDFMLSLQALVFSNNQLALLN